MKIIKGIPELSYLEKKGLGALFEVQKSQDIESCQEYLCSYIKFLLQNGACFLALFIMRIHKNFNTEATNIAISNSIAINSKVIITIIVIFIYFVAIKHREFNFI